MKIELIKKDKIEGTYFFTYVDGNCDEVFLADQEEKATARYNYLVERAKFPVTETTIQSIEI